MVKSCHLFIVRVKLIWNNGPVSRRHHRNIQEHAKDMGIAFWICLHEFFEPFPKQALVFTCLQYKCFENTMGKGEIARKEQFLLFPLCFLPVLRICCHFHKI